MQCLARSQMLQPLQLSPVPSPTVEISLSPAMTPASPSLPLGAFLPFDVIQNQYIKRLFQYTVRQGPQIYHNNTINYFYLILFPSKCMITPYKRQYLSFYLYNDMSMNPNSKLKKFITPKRLENILKHQEHLQVEKQYNPGKVDIESSPNCSVKLVNFFGDVHTEVFSIKVNSNDKHAAVGCSNGEAKAYDIYEGKVINIGYTSRMAGFPCTAVKWKPVRTTDYVACNCDGTIKWYNLTSDTAYGHYEREQKSYLCCDYQSHEEWCVFGTDINTIQIFDNETMKPIHQYAAGGPGELTNNHHTNRVFSVKCLPKEKHDKNVFFSGGWDNTVHIWDVRAKEGSQRMIHGPTVSADSLDYKNGVILAGNYRNNDIAQLYDFGSGKLIENLDIGEPHNSKSYCFTATFAQRSEHDLMAVGLTNTNCVKILQDKMVVSTVKFQAAPLSMDFYRFGNKDFLIVGGLEGTIYVLKIKITA